MSSRAALLVSVLFAGFTLAATFGGTGDPAPRTVAAGADAIQSAPPGARAVISDADGARIGTAELRQAPSDQVLIRVRLTDGPRGTHAIHIHETGECRPFSAAGGHFAPRGHEHGILDPQGKHAGDLPNLHVTGDGDVEVEILAHDVSLRDGAEGSLFDDDGSAVVIHRGSDDYTTDPAGDSGPEIACGVVVRR